MTKLYEKIICAALAIIIGLVSWNLKATVDGRVAQAAQAEAMHSLENNVLELKAQSVPRQELEARLLDIKTRVTAIEAEMVRLKSANDLK